MNAKTTKKATSPKRGRRSSEGLDREYRFDYSKSRPNRFASKLRGAVVVVLDPDVARVFRDPKRVNSLLRATIAATDKRRSSRAG